MNAAAHICEKCRQTVPPQKPPPDPAFDDEWWTVNIGGSVAGVWHPGAMQWTIISELRKHLGRIVTYEQLLTAVNRGRSDPTTQRSLYQTIFNIRRRLAGTPFVIRSSRGRGFLMEKTR